MFRSLIATAAVAGALVAAAPSAQADYVFNACPSGRTGVASTVTSCAFADNVRYAWYGQGINPVAAYSPTTGLVYSMYCTSATNRLNNGLVTDGYLCEGGNNARVVIF